VKYNVSYNHEGRTKYVFLYAVTKKVAEARKVALIEVGYEDVRVVEQGVNNVN